MPDKTINEWCLSRNISRPTYYALKKKGLAPASYSIPGARGERITPAADRAWEKRMIALKQTKAAKQAAERRQQSAQNAGRIAVQSPLHVSNAGKAPKAAPAEPKRPVGRPKLTTVAPGSSR
jgi:hypothetical protein